MILAILVLCLINACLLVWLVLAMGDVQRGTIRYFRRVEGKLDNFLEREGK